MRDRRGAMRAPTRLQLLSVAGGLSSLPSDKAEAALAALYREQPMRWQAFMDEALVLIQAAAKAPEDPSGFADTVVPAE